MSNQKWVLHSSFWQDGMELACDILHDHVYRQGVNQGENNLLLR